MLGQQIEDGRGKRTSRRVISTDPDFKIEASVEERATFLGIEGVNIITYVASTKSDGSLEGEGGGVFASPQGDVVTWKGTGVGRFREGGAIQYCGALSFRTTSQNLASLNGIAGVFQWEIDPQGNTHSTMWELAPAGADEEVGVTMARAARDGR
jgi:hypothetical protein